MLHLGQPSLSGKTRVECGSVGVVTELVDHPTGELTVARILGSPKDKDLELRGSLAGVEVGAEEVDGVLVEAGADQIVGSDCLDVEGGREAEGPGKEGDCSQGVTGAEPGNGVRKEGEGGRVVGGIAWCGRHLGPGGSPAWVSRGQQLGLLWGEGPLCPGGGW